MKHAVADLPRYITTSIDPLKKQIHFRSFLSIVYVMMRVNKCHDIGNSVINWRAFDTIGWFPAICLLIDSLLMPHKDTPMEMFDDASEPEIPLAKLDPAKRMCVHW